MNTMTAHPNPSIGVASLPIITADHHRLIKAYTPMSDLYINIYIVKLHGMI